MEIIINEMTLFDFEKIKDILITDFDEFWNPEILENELKKLNSKYIVAKIENEIVGFAGINYNYDYVEIMNIVSKKTYRRKGIASALLEKLILNSKEFNVSKIGLEVSEKNIPAIKLYEKLGFKQVGRRKKYYNGIYDAILMDFYFC